MPKSAMMMEFDAAVTERGQTTVPSAIRKMLGLGKRGRIVFRSMPDGTVSIRKKERPADDPALAPFLSFLEKDIQVRPEALTPVHRTLVDQARALVAGVDIDLDAALPDDDA